jgi:hypothetical protein
MHARKLKGATTNPQPAIVLAPPSKESMPVNQAPSAMLNETHNVLAATTVRSHAKLQAPLARPASLSARTTSRQI